MNNTTYEYVKFCYLADSASFIILHFPSRRYIINQVVVCAANCVLVIPTVLLNGISILTITKSSQLKERICFFLILIQAMVDLAVGAVSLPLETFIRAREILGTASCNSNFALSSIALMPFGLALTTTCAFTFERYLGILHPIVHRTYLTRKKFLIYIFFSAIALLVLVPLGLASKKAYHIVGVAVITIPLVFNAFAYIKIFLAGRKSLHSNDTTGTFTDASKEPNVSEKSRKKQFLKELKLAKSCALVVFTFYMCFLQAPILNFIFVNDEPANFRVAQSWAATISALNSSLNSIIFFWQSPLLRTEAMKACISLCRR